MADESDLHQLRKDAHIEGNFVLYPVPALDLLGFLIQVDSGRLDQKH
jgi:hypothetical protein